MLLVLHAAQVLAHYLMINQLSANANSCEQTALEGSQSWSIIICDRLRQNPA